MRNEPNSAMAGGHPGANRAKRTQFATRYVARASCPWIWNHGWDAHATTSTAKGETCETNPNLGRPGDAGKGSHRIWGTFLESGTCTMKPIPGYAGWGGPEGRGAGTNVQNKAKPGQNGTSGGRRPRGASRAKQSQFAPDRPEEAPPERSARVSAGQGKCAKQTQSAPERRQRQVLYGQGIMVNHACKGGWQNKANPGDSGRDRIWGTRDVKGNRAKQSQLATDGAGIPSPRPEALTLPPARRQSCETKPIREPGRSRGSIVRNKPNSPQIDQRRHRRREAKEPTRARANAPNKPNWHRSDVRGKSCMDTNSPPGSREDHRRPEALAMPRRKGNCAKQTQFPTPGGAGRGVDCATSPRCPASGNKPNSQGSSRSCECGTRRYMPAAPG